MEGIVFFGPHTIDVNSWKEQSLIDISLDKAMGLIIEINKSDFAVVRVPEDWSTFQYFSRNFWDNLETVFQGKNDLLTYVTTKLFDEVFKKCIVKNGTYEDAEESLKNRNPNFEKMEYYAALKLDQNWPQIPTELHVSNYVDARAVALKFLAEEPLSEKNYSVRCENIFSNLNFHTDFSDTLYGHGKASKKSNYSNAPITGICGFSGSVTKSLTTLNSIDLCGKTTSIILAEIAAISGFDCTVEGANKAHLRFKHKDDEEKPINCEFHIKIDKNNQDDGVHYQDRIYFGFIGQGADKKIFVAHSGKHL